MNSNKILWKKLYLAEQVMRFEKVYRWETFGPEILTTTRFVVIIIIIIFEF